MKGSLLFPAAVVLLAHATFVAFLMRDELQAHHHGVGGAIISGSRADSAPLSSTATSTASPLVGGSVLPLYVVVEVLLGLVLAIGGCASSSSLHKVRQQDYLSSQSYDQSIFSGYEFAHFNHRGFAAVAASEKKQQ
jgi:hypothetical protein